MSYFSEVSDYKTYVGQAEDFHFSYNVNSGGGQSFLGGKFRDENGSAESASVLNGRMGVFQFRTTGEDGVLRCISLEDGETKYEIKPRASGDNNMKLGVEGKKTPSVAIAAFLMLPKPSGVKRADRVDISPLCTKNYWLQSMWMSVDKTTSQIATLIPKDCIFSGGVDRNEDGQLRNFKVDFAKRISDIIAVAKSSKLDRKILDCVNWFADVYEGRKDFVCDEAITAIENVMKYLQQKYPDRYSGLMDPLPVITELANLRSEEPKLKDIDRITIALRCFELARGTEKTSDGWTSYDAWAEAARQMFADVDAAKLTAEGFDYYADFARKFVYNSTVANAYFKNHGADGQIAVGNFLARERQSPHAVSWYLDPDNRPMANKKPVSGMAAGVILNFMMKLRPSEFATYSPLFHKMCVATGLTKIAYNDKLTVESYEASKALQGQVLAKMHELHIGQTADSEMPADYLTVNEFAWWLSDEKNLNLVKEKVMSQKLKTINSKDRIKNGTRKLSDAFNDDMMKRLAAALRTKPFAILAGHSGTGKSQLVRRLAYMTCNNQDLIDEGKGKTAPGNYCMVQVKPNWHDSTDLLGYYTDLGGRHFVNTAFMQFLCKAYAYPETPFFLCLDEMNLAPVEQYFAEYLSAVESLEPKDGVWLSDSLVEVVRTNEKDANGNAKPDPDILAQIMEGAASTEAADWITKHGVTIPKNLFVVGTVNMDETTCQFSRKVLDRAMTLLMNEAKFADMNKTPEPNKEDLLDEKGIGFFLLGGRRGSVGATEAGLLDKVNETLVNTPFVIAYRFANEYALYEEALANLNGVEVPAEDADEATKTTYRTEVTKYAEDALDQVVLMKLLPRIHGMKDIVKGIFEGRKIGDKSIDGLSKRVKAGGLSASMMAEITKRGDEYLTFWP